MGCMVGAMICYQILYTGITERLPQYAALRAMGYGDDYLFRNVLQEALFLSLLGFLPGLIIGLQAYRVLQWLSGTEMQLTLLRVIPVFLLTVGMCCFAGIFAARKAMRLDPATVFE